MVDLDNLSCIVGHHYGQCLISHRYQLVFVNIPKNGSQSLKQMFRPKGFVYDYTSKHDTRGYEYITILRSPMSRFISGYIESNQRAYPIMKTFNYWTRPESTDRMLACLEQIPPKFYDEHLTPQVYFLHEININTYLCFDHLEQELAPYLNIIGVRKILKENISKLKDKQVILNNLTTEVFDMIARVYSDDYDLYNRHCCH